MDLAAGDGSNVSEEISQDEMAASVPMERDNNSRDREQWECSHAQQKRWNIRRKGRSCGANATGSQYIQINLKKEARFV